MSSAELVQREADNRYGHDDAVDYSTNILLKGKENDLFAALLDEFTGSAWPLLDAKIMRRRPTSISTSKDEDEEKEQDKTERFSPKDNSKVCVADPWTIGNTVRDKLHSESPKTYNHNDTSKNKIDTSAKLLVSSSPVSDKDEAADASRCPDASAVHRVISYASMRRITNTTYLRRMHLSKEDALGLFPEVKDSLAYVFKALTKRQASSGHVKLCTSVRIRDPHGTHWPVVLECFRAAGLRHVRLNKGWADMCIANGLAVGRNIRLARWERPSSVLSSPLQGNIVTFSVL